MYLKLDLDSSLIEAHTVVLFAVLLTYMAFLHASPLILNIAFWMVNGSFSTAEKIVGSNA